MNALGRTRVLFVAPSELSAGEALVAVDVAREIVAEGSEVGFLGTPYTGRFARSALPSATVVDLGPHRAANQRRWDAFVGEFSPDVIVFADYPLLFFRSGSAPLADEAWIERLGDGGAELVTLDCLGYAQRAQSMFFGPPHLSAQVERLPALPPGMSVLLPCPLHEPAPRAGRTGVPFRYGRGANADRAAPVAARQAYASDDELLIVHLSSAWARDWADALGLPHYGVLPEILEHYLAGLPRAVAVVSVNDGRLLPPVTKAGFRVGNVSRLSPDAFDALILAADLVLGDNRVSISLGKAACALRPCAVLRNGYTLSEALGRLDGPLREVALGMERARLGAIFPYDVFPIWGPAELAQLGVMTDNGFGSAVTTLELLGGESTRRRFRSLLLDPETRAGLRAAQERYARRVRALPVAHEVLAGARR